MKKLNIKNIFTKKSSDKKKKFSLKRLLLNVVIGIVAVGLIGGV